MDGARNWLPRHATSQLREALADTPVVCLLGPRQSGKSTLARRLDPDRAYLTFDDAGLLYAASADPVGFLAGLPDPITLDEIQRVPQLLPAIKMVVDRHRRPGRFLLTGSADLLLLSSVSESLAGRMAIVRLHPLTEAEKERRPGAFLQRLLEGSFASRVLSVPPDPHDLVRRVLQGGYPEAVSRDSERRVRQWHRDYVSALIQRDSRDVARLRDLDRLADLLTLLAHQTSQLLNIASLSKHLAIRRETVENHLSALERLFLVRRLAAWHPNDSRRLVKAPKVHLVDSGLASTLAGATADDWLSNRARLGHALESFVVQQISASATRTDPDLRLWHYRDKDQVEVDLVVTLGERTWGVEVKAAATVTPGDGRGLRRLADLCGDRFQGGVLLHAGVSALPMPQPRCLAVPLTTLWTI